MIVAGVDGCPGGWIMALKPSDGALRFSLAETWRELPETPQIVAVDMPIGLAEHGPRACDGAARRLLGRIRAGSVFPVPNRPMLTLATWEEANAWGKARGRGLPRQSWGLIERIRELDKALSPADQDRVFEAHPELVFRHLNGGTPPPPKRTVAGRNARRALLATAGVDGLDAWMARWPRRLAGVDDLYDAAALVLAAERIGRGEAVCLPPDPPRDARGLRMEIWY